MHDSSYDFKVLFNRTYDRVIKGTGLSPTHIGDIPVAAQVWKTTRVEVFNAIWGSFSGVVQMVNE